MSNETAGEKFQRLVAIMARLRAPDGCPWDREQTFDSIKPYTLEETYEVLDAIDRREWSDLMELYTDDVESRILLGEDPREIAEEEDKEKAEGPSGPRAEVFDLDPERRSSA